MKDAAAQAQGGLNDCKQDGGGSACCSKPGARSSAGVAVPAPTGAASLTPEEQQAIRKARRDRARETKLMQNITKVKSAHLQKKKHGGGGSKRRWGRGRGKNKSNNGGAAGDGGGSTEENAPDVFDQWLGAKLTAWSKGTTAQATTPTSGSALARPPEGSGVIEEIDFDPTKDEIGEGEAVLCWCGSVAVATGGQSGCLL